jgi:hypothetical protein
MMAYTAFIGKDDMEAAFALAEITKVLPFMEELKPFLELVGPERANLLMTSGNYHFPIFGAKEPSVHDERQARRIVEGLLDIAGPLSRVPRPTRLSDAFSPLQTRIRKPGTATIASCSLSRASRNSKATSSSMLLDGRSLYRSCSKCFRR